MIKRQNFSRKREAILEAIRSTTAHPTAEWIYQQLKPAYPDLSLGTVYRNLAQFRAEGLIISVGVVDGQERYDGNTAPHVHFVCEKCAAVIDIDDLFLDSAQSMAVAEKYGFAVDYQELVFHGTCSQCLQGH